MEIIKYNNKLNLTDKLICEFLTEAINSKLKEAESKIWHGHPVWFLDKNPIVGYSKQKLGIRLMFWSGADFDEKELNIIGKKFKDASVFFNDFSEINLDQLNIWLDKSIKIQWDYKNIIKKKGQLIKLK